MVARGNYTRQETLQLVHDLRSLLQECGYPAVDVDDQDSKRILISRTDDGVFLCIQGDYTASEVHLILMKLK